MKGRNLFRGFSSAILVEEPRFFACPASGPNGTIEVVTRPARVRAHECIACAGVEV